MDGRLATVGPNVDLRVTLNMHKLTNLCLKLIQIGRDFFDLPKFLEILLD